MNRVGISKKRPRTKIIIIFTPSDEENFARVVSIQCILVKFMYDKHRLHYDSRNMMISEKKAIFFRMLLPFSQHLSI